MIGQRESLPNLIGKSFTTIAAGTSMAAASTITSGASGVFYPEDYTDGNVNLTYSTGRVPGYSKLGFDASKTTGTGSGVYKEGAHVQPGNISCNIWLRLA